jgi:hypothetical protein
MTPSPTSVATFTTEQLLSTASTGLERIRNMTESRQLICLRYEDLDSDGKSEWFALTHQIDNPPNLQAIVLDDDVTHTLVPAKPEPGVPDVGFGQFPVCDIKVQDINLDGQTDIIIIGHTTDNETLLHVFSWNPIKAEYTMLGYFTGDAGVMLTEVDGDLAFEIWEGYRIREAPSLTWYVINTWQDQTYGWTSDRYDWYSRERPHSYPTHQPEYAVISFYLALDDRDLPGAFDLLMPQTRTDYKTWATGYSTTVRIDVGGVHTLPGNVTADRTRVATMVTSYDNEYGVVIKRLWTVEWDTAYTEQGWRLLSSTAELLEEAKATYFP